ncbi:RNA polymerase recycling motor ATPase HelR [Microlunatus sp. Gsoil 973]|uniref:RNA polymerase recycling motor ATPase HelR n=1 Tax=Microlunatus sp. Gsoil 973 TaxID=2672569 RepID=UPI0012B4861B|nr:RNA polymerase recycling motor ATPase HelR [Microlunatus sp. Gsoil 973]QGN33326.1 AAA family ATPase [Microlunatus sp. Gsoil 973]
MTTSVFQLAPHHPATCHPELVADDEQLFTAMATNLDRQLATLSGQLDQLRRSPGGKGRAAADRDIEIHRISARLRLLRRFGLDLCLGRMVPADGSEPVYIGRLGLTDDSDRRLLIDWRTPAAEPYFAATAADPMGLASRRRYRWSRGRITDFWDEVFPTEGRDIPADGLVLDEDSAFIASLAGSRSPRMRDVLGTIQADQDAAIRAGSRGALVVAGGPGTGKTVVALHRAAFLLYSDPRISDRRGGVLFVGPHRPYLAYVSDVLPSLGEEGVQICTLADLLPQGATAAVEADPAVARLKSSAGMVSAIEPAVRLYEEPPSRGFLIGTDWGDVRLTTDDWAEAFESVDPGTPHNEAHAEIWDALVTVLLDKLGDQQAEDVDPKQFARDLRNNDNVADALSRAWTLIDAKDLVGDLWSVPAYLRRCAPWLQADEVAVLQRDDPQAWTVSDLPLLDAARQRLGDRHASARNRRRAAAIAAERELMDRVVDDIIAADDDPETSMYMLRGEDLRQALVDESGLPSPTADRLAGPFAHIMVDEAQELTDAEWQMLLRRCPSRSFTIVGDRAQARHGFAETWQERLRRVGFDAIEQITLTINYRTPREVMASAEPVIRAALPDANVPTSIRSSGLPVITGSATELEGIVDDWLADNPEGIGCVIGDPGFTGRQRLRSLTPAEAKGMEFDLVVLVRPDSFGTGIEGAVDRYVAMTRATRQLVILD